MRRYKCLHDSVTSTLHCLSKIRITYGPTSSILMYCKTVLLTRTISEDSCYTERDKVSHLQLLAKYRHLFLQSPDPPDNQRIGPSLRIMHGILISLMVWSLDMRFDFSPHTPNPEFWDLDPDFRSTQTTAIRGYFLRKWTYPELPALILSCIPEALTSAAMPNGRAISFGNPGKIAQGELSGVYGPCCGTLTHA